MDKTSYVIHDEENIKGFFGNYRWLSNFHECEIHLDGFVFPSVENAYVYNKLDLYGKDLSNPDKLTYTHKLLSCSPAEAKKIGRTMSIRETWDRVKFDVMSAVVFEKFYRHVPLRDMLLATGYKRIEETNHWGDTWWGVCDGRGQNNLGKILMRIRDFWGAQYPDKLGLKTVTPLF